MYQINNKGNWIALKKKIRLAILIVTVDDLKLDAGNERSLLDRLQKKLSKTKKKLL
jgi:hypothetical protein